MAETTTICPKCKEAELNFEVEHHSADDGAWYSAGYIAGERLCDCEFTDEEMECLEIGVAAEYAESVYAYEP